MNLVPHIPESAPFSPEQRAWLNGFLAGLFSRTAAAGPAPGATSPAVEPLAILFGTQTGTAETLARKAAKEASRRGFAPTVVDMAQFPIERLAGERKLLVIVSTYGDGEPPDSAKALHLALAGQEPPLALSQLRFTVCALGDRNYPQFCRCGADFDHFLEKHGAVRACPRADCDVDGEAAFDKWLSDALDALSERAAGTIAPATLPPSEAGTRAEHDDADTGSAGYSRKNPFPARILAVRRLSSAASAKEVNHVELSLADSGLVYEAGDALGVMPQNCPGLVAEILERLGCDGEEAVPAPDGKATSLRHALLAHYDLGRPGPEFLQRYAAGTTHAPAGAAGVATASGAVTLQVIDHLQSRLDLRPTPGEFVGSLRRLQPRLYSISSSPRAHPGEVHLTVGAVRYAAHGRARKGVCSTFLAERATAAGHVGVYVHPNPNFRLPAGDTAMVMIGPGTGIAPFRAFLEDRQATGASGRNWLLFGDRHEAHDFLYREQLLNLQSAGTLHRLDLAWSRDQSEKIYVQSRLLAAADELWSWIDSGAHVYVCGDASRMARDVDAALLRVIATAGGKSEEDAAVYLQSMKAARRYQRDVY